MFLDRLNTLLQKCGLDPAVSGKIHKSMDALDAFTHFYTTGGLREAPLGLAGVVPVNHVGERLRIHERHMSYSPDSYINKKASFKNSDKFFFWIGGELVAKSL